jgi:ribosomal protein S18 acetylase RimI-like enzyme
MGEEVRIHEYRPGEDAKLIELFSAVLPDFAISTSSADPGPGLFLTDPRSFALGAYLGDVPAGLLWGVLMRSPKGRLTTYVHELDVREQWRRRGVATQLMTAAFALALDRGSTRLWLVTEATNGPARALYESIGGEASRTGDTIYRWQLKLPTYAPNCRSELVVLRRRSRLRR